MYTVGYWCFISLPLLAIEALGIRKDRFVNIMLWRSGSALNCYNYERLLFDAFDPLQDGVIKLEDFESVVREFYPKVIIEPVKCV